jgi:hypothetical protein
MLLFRADPFGGTHELPPCGLPGGDLVELFRKNESKYYWYGFTVRGERYRGSTKETNETRAQKAAALKLAATIKAAIRSTGSHPRFVNTRKISFNGSKRDGSRPAAAALSSSTINTVGVFCEFIA